MFDIIKTLWTIIVVSTLLMTIVSCDNRNPSKPEIIITGDIAPSFPDTLYTHPNFSSENVTIRIISDYPALYVDQRIDYDYDHSIVTIALSGDQSYCYTDTTGSAYGFIQALRVGATNIRFYLREYNDVSVTKYVKVINPFISKMTSTPISVVADGLENSVITVWIKPEIEGQQIVFTTTLGTLQSNDPLTVSFGQVSNTISCSEPGLATITATMSIPNLPTATQTVYVDFY